MKRSAKVWACIGAGVLAHNLTADDGDTLSEGVDQWLTAYPRLTRSVIIAIALHLVNAISPDLDPVHLAFLGVRSLSRRRRVIVVVEPTWPVD